MMLKDSINEFNRADIQSDDSEFDWCKGHPSMVAGVKKISSIQEFETDERCYISDISNDSGDEHVSIARARVRPGVTTAWHKLNGVDERYIIISGTGCMEIGDLGSIAVCEGDVVRIPACTPQRIQNTGELDLIFFCICSPPYQKDCYIHLD
jgi:mannose-6-phosphate isomerase-like protein (cupin superfamily)